MAQAGVVLVSGMADGLDSEAHRAAVQAEVPTVAFLGTAIDKTYPAANAKLRTAIEKGGGAVCSEYPPGYTGRTTGTFLARNRLIAAQSEVLCVAEARTRSGTLNTVGHAERLGRPVLAVPGSIYSALSEGTNELLCTHRAEPLCKAADALDILGIGAETADPAQQRFDPAAVSPDAQAVYAVLKPTPQGIDALCARPPACPPAACWRPVRSWNLWAVHRPSRDADILRYKIIDNKKGVRAAQNFEQANGLRSTIFLIFYLLSII